MMALFEQVNAEIEAVKVPAKVLEYTAGCTDFEKDLAQFRGSCKTLLRLRAQLSDAQQARAGREYLQAQGRAETARTSTNTGFLADPPLRTPDPTLKTAAQSAGAISF